MVGAKTLTMGVSLKSLEVRWLDRRRRSVAQRKAKELLQNVKAPNLEKGNSRNMSCLAEWLLFLRTSVRMKGVGVGARDDLEAINQRKGSSGCRREEQRGGRRFCTWLSRLQRLT